MNWYKNLLRPLLFVLPPETAHALALSALKWQLIPSLKTALPQNKVELWGKEFLHPLGLAAGFDKNGEAIAGLFKLGFSFVEIGGVLPKPQYGNPKPRLFRAPSARAIINRLGLGSKGVDEVVKNVTGWRNTDPAKTQILGANIAPNKDSEDRVGDYIQCLEKLAAIVDYLSLNVSSPNTPGLRGLQDKTKLADLIRRLQDKRASLNSKVPLVLKIAPDLDQQAQNDIADIALAENLDGLAISNTTIARPTFLSQDFAKETGGLSGAPLFAPSTDILRSIASRIDKKIPLIGIGGISSADEAREKIAAGATLIQLYTGLVYEGPKLVSNIVSAL